MDFCPECLRETTNIFNSFFRDKSEKVFRRSLCKECNSAKIALVLDSFKKQGMIGANPALIAAVAQSIPSVSNIITGITSASDHAAQRGFEKNKTNGTYDRQRARNERFMSQKNLSNDMKLYDRIKHDFKKRGIPMTNQQIWDYIESLKD